jgi:outer membrane protein assembly factor BamE
LPQTERQDKNVVVPLSEQKTGFFNGLMNFIGLGGDDEVEIIDEDESVEDLDEEQAEADKAMMEQAETDAELDTSDETAAETE